MIAAEVERLDREEAQVFLKEAERQVASMAKNLESELPMDKMCSRTCLLMTFSHNI